MEQDFGEDNMSARRQVVWTFPGLLLRVEGWNWASDFNLSRYTTKIKLKSS